MRAAQCGTIFTHHIVYNQQYMNSQEQPIAAGGTPEVPNLPQEVPAQPEVPGIQPIPTEQPATPAGPEVTPGREPLTPLTL
jgi:hypothetical protein